MSLGLTISSFIAGIFTFFAPCTLPLVPAFLGIISGVPAEELQNPEKLKQVRWKIFSNALFYVFGFSIVFILFGVAFSYLGQFAIARIWLQRIGGILIILFGLFLMNLIKVRFLSVEKQIHVPKFFSTPTKGNSFLIGSLFALGWSPCVGPLLGSILLLASTTSTVFQGVFLLAVFSAGLALPFLITSLLVGKAFSVFGNLTTFLKVINIIAGIFLVTLGILLITDQFSQVFFRFQGFLYQFDFFINLVERFL